jgi:hypothetical protein
VAFAIAALVLLRVVTQFRTPPVAMHAIDLLFALPQ